MRVKICGLTRLEDALLAQELGAWALGFIFYPESKRYINPQRAGDIVADLPAEAQTIGVVVNQREAVSIAQEVGLSGLQLHGDETPDECARVRKDWRGLLIKALRPEKESDLNVIASYKGIVDYILIDAAVAGAYGGTGRAADLGLAITARKCGVPVILAGGLAADNIAAANIQVRPYALDLSSGVESSPGVKDKAKLEALFKVTKGTP